MRGLSIMLPFLVAVPVGIQFQRRHLFLYINIIKSKKKLYIFLLMAFGHHKIKGLSYFQIITTSIRGYSATIYVV